MAKIEKSISLFFNIDRVYVAVLERQDNNINLAYVDATDHVVDIEHPESESNNAGINELTDILADLELPEKINVSLPCESILVTSFPSRANITQKEIVQLVNLEVRQIYPQFELEQFSVIVNPLTPTKDNKHFMIASIIDNQILQSTKEFLKGFGVELGKVEISQFAAHNAFAFNYPEIADKNILLASVQNQFIDISVLSKNKPAYYNLLAYAAPDKIPEVFEAECNKITENIVTHIDYAFFFGSGLTKEINMALWETSMLFGFETKRLNPFRMMTSSLDARTKEYCSRVFHLYPAVIGVNFPSLHERIIIKK